MNIEQIEKILSEIIAQKAIASDADTFAMIQCQLLLLIYYRLDSIDDSLTDEYNARHNR